MVSLHDQGKVFVLATGTFTLVCSTYCERRLSVQVDGVTVPGAFAYVEAPAGEYAQQFKTFTGILEGVPAGAHEVRIASRMASGSGYVPSSFGDVRIVAVALGD